MKSKLINLLFWSLMATMTNSLANTAQTPDTIIKQAASSIIERIEKERSNLEADPEKIYVLVNELVVPYFDFINMSRLVLGKNWEKADESERMKFVDQFQILLVRTYSRAVLEYSGQNIKYHPAKQKPGSKFAVVKTELEGDNAKPLPVIYRVYKKNDEWKVVDIVVDGISIVSTYRSSFAAQIKKAGFASLIQQVKDKNNHLAHNLKK